MMKRVWKNKVFWICLTISLALLISSFIVPPTGVIDPSVLAAVGEIFGFATLWVVYEALNKGVDAKITHGDTTLELNNDDEEKVEE